MRVAVSGLPIRIEEEYGPLNRPFLAKSPPYPILWEKKNNNQKDKNMPLALPDPSFALRSEVLSDEERISLKGLRKALRLFEVADACAVLQGELTEGVKDKQYYLFRWAGKWTVVFMERGEYHRHACYFDRAQDACDYVFWKLTTKSPVTHKLEDADIAA